MRDPCPAPTPWARQGTSPRQTLTAARCSLTVTSQLTTLTDPPALVRDPPRHGPGSPGSADTQPGVPQLTLSSARGTPFGHNPLSGRWLRLPRGGRRLRGTFRAATSRPRARCRGDRAAHPPGPSRRWGGHLIINPPPFLFLFLSFPRSRTTREPKSLRSAGTKERRMREAPSGPARPLPPADARSAGRPQPLPPGSVRRDALGPPARTAAPARPAGRGTPASPGTCPRSHPAALRLRTPSLPCVCVPCRRSPCPLRSPAPYLRGGARRAAGTPPPRAGMTLRRNPSSGQENKPFLGVRGGRRRAGRRAPLKRPFPPRGQDGGDPCRYRRGAGSPGSLRRRPRSCGSGRCQLRLSGGGGRRGCGAGQGPGSPRGRSRAGQLRAPPAGRDRGSPGALGPAARPEPSQTRRARTRTCCQGDISRWRQPHPGPRLAFIARELEAPALHQSMGLSRGTSAAVPQPQARSLPPLPAGSP